MDTDMEIGELERLVDRVNIDTTAANNSSSSSSSKDLDLLAMDLDVAFQGLGTTASAPPPPPPPSPTRRGRSVVKYYYDYDALTAEGRPDFGLLRRNIRHIDSLVRSLASEPYATRRLAVRDLYRPFTHITRALAGFRTRGWGLNESHAEVGKYIRHLRNLKPIVTAFGSGNDETRAFGWAVDKLERTRLPEQKIIKLKVGNTRTGSTTSSSSSEGSQGGAGDRMDIDDRMAGLSQRLREFHVG